jgi:ATP-dependent RNA helicase DOB1
MTTEILRNMLFRGSEVMREVGYVVFDECHFMRDVERGVVWEESIILLPPSVTLVFLSATIANAVEFAQWVSSLKRKPCHVICTDFRPTPLQHFVFPQSGDGLYLVKDGAQPFRFDRFEELLRFANSTQSAGQSRSNSGIGDTVSKSDMRRIVQLLVAGEYNPAIVFSFSRAECEGIVFCYFNFDLMI